MKLIPVTGLMKHVMNNFTREAERHNIAPDVFSAGVYQLAAATAIAGMPPGKTVATYETETLTHKKVSIEIKVIK